MERFARLARNIGDREMNHKSRFHPALIAGCILFGLLFVRGCAEEFSLSGSAMPVQAMPGSYAGYYAPQAGGMSAPQWSSVAPQGGYTGGDNSYINRTTSGITVGGDGNGNFYVNDSGSGSSVANDGY
jgi:hypothetical protein